ncbi:MAG TPA: hypothetical protein VFZ52_18530 [Chryseolinea sp.]
MKNAIKGISLMGLLLAGAFVVNAQSGNSLTVSKGVQKYANKSAFSEESKKSNIQAKSVEFPAIAVSKGVVGSSNVETVGNIESKGYPTWAISKDVARKNQERTLERDGSQEAPSLDVTRDQNQISKR